MIADPYPTFNESRSILRTISVAMTDPNAEEICCPIDSRHGSNHGAANIPNPSSEWAKYLPRNDRRNGLDGNIHEILCGK